MPKSSLFRIVLILSLLANLACAVYIGRRFFTKPTPYIPPPRLSYYMGRDELFETLPVDTGAVVFLGNSHTQYFELAELLPGCRIKNRGIHGDELEKTLQRIGPVIRSKPSKLFIELGINDVEEERPSPLFFSLYSRLLDTLKAASPQTEIFVQSLLPVADSSRYHPS